MPRRRPLPSAERLRELFDYEPATGLLRAKVAKVGGKSPYKVGDALGYPDEYGYLKLTVDRFPYLVHRIIWKWVKAEEPPEYIDHKNRVRHDNSWRNLRASDKYRNIANTATRKPNGAKGVRPGATAGTWMATLTHRGRHHHLGTFSSEEEAIKAYRAKSLELRGEFDEIEHIPAVVDVIQLIDGRFLDAAVNTVRRARGMGLNRAIPAEVAAAFDRAVTELGNEIARVAPDRYGAMARRTDDLS